MGKDADIVKILREEEKKGLLASAVEICEEKPSLDNSYGEKIPDGYRENFDKSKTNISEASDSYTNLKNEVLELKAKNKEITDRLIESHERYNSLYEYFEIISDTTISLGKKDLFSNVNDIIFQVSPEGRITYINSAVESIAGYNSSNLIGKNLSMLMPKDDWKKVHKIFFPDFKTKNPNKEVNSFETVVIKNNGERVPVEINGKLIKYNIEVVGRVNDFRIQGSIRDISDRKRAEAERIRHAKELEDINEELNSTNEELRIAQEELEKFNQDLEKKVEYRTAEIQKLLKHKDEFIGQLGHDLKSPLTPLVGLLPTIERQEKDPKQKELLGIVNRNVLYMRDLVVKTLKLARLNSPNMQLHNEEFNLSEVVDRIIVNKSYVFEEKNLKIKNKIGKNLAVMADKLELKELLDNLFTNSIKFTPENGTIVFDATKDKDFIKISIKDSGVGLSSDQINHVFEEFYKVDSSRHDLDSSGLGLTICKRIVEQHNGNIWVESPGVNKGATFYFTLPVKQN